MPTVRYRYEAHTGHSRIVLLHGYLLASWTEETLEMCEWGDYWTQSGDMLLYINTFFLILLFDTCSQSLFWVILVIVLPE